MLVVVYSKRHHHVPYFVEISFIVICYLYNLCSDFVDQLELILFAYNVAA